MEAELSHLKAALGVEGFSTPTKAKKANKEKDPDAPKKAPNSYILFAMRVNEIFKAERAAAKEMFAADPDALATRLKRFECSATANKQFASFLKDQRSKEVEKDGKTVTVPDYDSWGDEEIIEAFAGWEVPEHSKMELEGKTKKASAAASVASASASASDDSASVSSAKPKKERKKRTDEEKAITKAKKAATIAAKKVVKPEVVEPVAEVIDSPKPAPLAPAGAVVITKPKFKVTKKVVYTPEQLRDFKELTVEGNDMGYNIRGDIVDDEGGYYGHYDESTETITKGGATPADWDAIVA